VEIAEYEVKEAGSPPHKQNLSRLVKTFKEREYETASDILKYSHVSIKKNVL